MAVYTWRGILDGIYPATNMVMSVNAPTKNPVDDDPATVISADKVSGNNYITTGPSLAAGLPADFPSSLSGINSFTIRMRSYVQPLGDDTRDCYIYPYVMVSEFGGSTVSWNPIATKNQAIVLNDANFVGPSVLSMSYAIQSVTPPDWGSNAAALWADVVAGDRYITIPVRLNHAAQMASDGPSVWTVDYLQIEIDYTPTATGPVAKVWNGTDWVTGAKFWNGSAWKSDAKVWNGTEWVPFV